MKELLAIAVIAGMIATASAVFITRAFGDDNDGADGINYAGDPPIPRHVVRDWQCGAVTLRMDVRYGPNWNQTTYSVINPDAIPYIRDAGPTRFFVQWNSSRRGELVTLNGWQCQPVR